MKVLWKRWKRNNDAWIAEHLGDVIGVVYRDAKAYCIPCFLERSGTAFLAHLLKRFSPMLVRRSSALDRLFPEQYRCMCCHQTLPGLPEIVFLCAVCARAANPHYMIQGYNEDIGTLTFIPLCQRCENVRQLSRQRIHTHATSAD